MCSRDSVGRAASRFSFAYMLSSSTDNLFPIRAAGVAGPQFIGAKPSSLHQMGASGSPAPSSFIVTAGFSQLWFGIIQLTLSLDNHEHALWQALCAALRAEAPIPAFASLKLLTKQRNFPGTAQCLSNWTDHSCQRIKLVGERHRIRTIDRELPLADHVHEFGFCRISGAVIEIV